MFVTRSRLWLSLMVIMAASFAFAQSETPKLTMRIEVDATQNMFLKFSDGREAQVFSKISSAVSAPILMDMTENTCLPMPELTSCTMIFNLHQRQLSIRWTRNPDATKLGELVKFKFSGEANILLEEAQLTPAQNGEKDLFVCDDNRWITGGKIKTDISRTNLILSWGAENNLQNSETEVNENMTSGGAFNLLLTGRMGRYYHFKSDQYITAFSANPLPLAGGINTLVLRNPNSQEICQAQFSSNFAGALKAIGRAGQELSSQKAIAIPLNKSMQNLVRDRVSFLEGFLDRVQLL